MPCTARGGVAALGGLHDDESVTDTSGGVRAALLRAYDDQLRTDAETPGALAVRRLGPLRLATFADGRGFISGGQVVGAGRLEPVQGTDFAGT